MAVDKSTLVESANIENVKKFKSMVKVASKDAVTRAEKNMLDSLPNSFYEKVFNEVYGGDLELAKSVLYNRYESSLGQSPDQIMDSLRTYSNVVNSLFESAISRSPLLVIEVGDDSVVNETVAQFQRVSGGSVTHIKGDDSTVFSKTIVDEKLASLELNSDSDFTIVLIGDGVNRKPAQDSFLKSYPNANLVIVDDNIPQRGKKVGISVPREKPRSWLVSPFLSRLANPSAKYGGLVSNGYMLACMVSDILFKMQNKQMFTMSKEKLESVSLKLKDSAEVAIESGLLSKSISTIPKATDMLLEMVVNKEPALMISDTDADGDMAQSIAMQMIKVSGHDITVKSKEYNPETHGFSVAQVSEWITNKGVDKNEAFTVIVADLGTNQIDEQRLFLSAFSKAKLIIVDHHPPNAGEMVSLDRSRSTLVSPHIKGSLAVGGKAGGGVSASYLLAELFEQSLKKMKMENVINTPLTEIEQSSSIMLDMGRVGNLFDMVDCNVKFKPMTKSAIKKAYDIQKKVGPGRSMGLWCSVKQSSNISALSDVMKGGNERLEDIRKSMLKFNHYAGALVEVMHKSIEIDGYSDNDMSKDMAIYLASNSYENSLGKNNIELLKPYLFNFAYESSLDVSIKKSWSKLAEFCLSKVAGCEREILDELRKFSLVKTDASDNVMIRSVDAREVLNAFSTNQLKRAFSGVTKSVDMFVANRSKNRLSLRVRSDFNMYDIIKEAETEFPLAKLDFAGHSGAGVLNVTADGFVPSDVVVKSLLEFVEQKVVAIKESLSIDNAIMVEPTQLPFIQSLFETMLLNINPKSAPKLLLRVKGDMVFDDPVTAKKMSISDVVTKSPWTYSKEYIDFNKHGAIVIPNQALSVLVKDDFDGAVNLTLGGSGVFSGGEVFTGAQLKDKNIPSLETTHDKRRDNDIAYYKENFYGKDIPLIDVSKEEGIAKLEIMKDSKSAYESMEASILGLLSEKGADSLVVVDNEGVVTAMNLGMVIVSKKPGSGTPYTKEQFISLSEIDRGEVRHFRYQNANEVLVNEEVSIKLFSQLVNEDGGEPVKIDQSTQNLTNISQEMLNEVGESSDIVQKRAMTVLEGCGKFIFQAHNVSFDDNILKKTFPELHDFMDSAMRLDTMKVASNESLMYTNLSVIDIEEQSYQNSYYEGFSLPYMLESNVGSFEFPSIKGDHILKVLGDELFVYHKDSMLSSSVPYSRSDLLERTRVEFKDKVRHPRSNIADLMKVATIKDMLDESKKKNSLNKIAYGGLLVGGQLDSLQDKIPSLPPDAWAHFQQNYNFSLNVNQNVNNFLELPAYSDVLAKTVILDYLPTPGSDLYAGKFLNNDALKLPKEPAEPKDDKPATLKKHATAVAKYQAALDDLRTFSVENALRANASRFVQSNPEMVKVYSETHLYLQVLKAYEPTVQVDSLDRSIISGVSAETGVSESKVKEIYSDVMNYKGINSDRSIFANETHANIGLDGDVWQELNVVMHLLVTNNTNNYLVGSHAPMEKPAHQAVIDKFSHQVALNTSHTVAKKYVEQVVSSSTINKRETKSLMNLSDEGVSIKSRLSDAINMNLAPFESKSKSVLLDLSNIDRGSYLSLGDDDKAKIERMLTDVVGVSVLSNSKASMTSEVSEIIAEIFHSPRVSEAFRYVNEKMPDAFSETRGEDASDALKKIYTYLVTGGKLAIPGNRTLSHNDLAIVRSAANEINDSLVSQNFKIKGGMDVVMEGINVSEIEFELAELGIPSGKAVVHHEGYPDDKFRGTVQSNAIKAIEARKSVIGNALPERLSLSLVNKTTTPEADLITSDLVETMMDLSLPKLKNDDFKLTSDVPDISRKRK